MSFEASIHDETSSNKSPSMQSTVREHVTPGGWKFDAARNANPQDLEVYEHAIDEVVDIISQFEPGIKDRIPTNTLFSYFCEKVLMHTKEPAVRKMVIEKMVAAFVESGDTGSAITILSNNSAVDIPELQNSTYIGSLLEQAQTEGNSFQEYWLVRHVADIERHGELKEKLFKYDSDETMTENWKYRSGWQERELVLLERRSREVLQRLQEKPDATIYSEQDLFLELSFLNADWMAQELFYKKQRSMMAQEIYTAFYKMQERSGAAGEFLVKKAAEWGVGIRRTTPRDEVGQRGSWRRLLGQR